MMGLATVLGLARKGFFIPYRYANVVPRPGARAPYAILGELLHEHEDDFRTLLDGMDGFASALKSIGGDRPPEPRWNQDWPPLDAAAAYTLVRAGGGLAISWKSAPATPPAFWHGPCGTARSTAASPPLIRIRAPACWAYETWNCCAHRCRISACKYIERNGRGMDY